MAQEFTVSELLAQAHSSLKGRSTEEQVIRVWRTVGRLLETQLLNGRGLRIEKFATIAVTDARTLDVQCTPEFLQQSGVRPVAVPTRGTISAGKLNMVQLAQTTGLEKSDVARIMDRIVAVLGKLCFAGAAVKLTLLPVLQIEIKDKRLSYHVLPEFNSRLQRAWQANRRLLQQQQQQQQKVARVERADSDASLSIFSADLPGTPSLMHSPRSRASTPSERWAKPVRPRPSFTRSSFDPRSRAAAAVDDGTIVQRVKAKILARAGVQGIRGISRLLRIMDDNRDGKLSRSELKYGLADFGIDVTNIELEQLMRHFDRDKSGSIDLNEFLVSLRGELSERRLRVLRRAFAGLDKDADKQISLRDIQPMYDARQHPDVQAGRMTEEQALWNFMSQWDRHDKDGVITFDEFLDYYRDISASIDDDEYFEVMIENAWRLNAPSAQHGLNMPVSECHDDELSMQFSSFGIMHDPTQRQWSSNSSRTKRQIDKGSVFSRASTTSQRRSGARPSSTRDAQQTISPAAEGASGPYEILRELLYSPPCSLEGLMNRLRVSLINERPSLSLAGFTTQLQRLDPTLTSSQLRALARAADVLGVGSVDLSELHKVFVEKFGRDKTAVQTGNVVERVRAKVLQRAGQAGFHALRRILKVMDASGDNRLSKEELKYGLADYGIHLNLLEVDGVFSYFDRNRDGQVDISEFLRGVRGDMNGRRRQLVLQAFDILDRDRSGSITVDEMRERYDVSAMPEVRAGSITPEQALKQFLAQWERGNSDGVVTRDEFIDYYTDLSALIDGDDYFELMVRNAWHIPGGSGWAENTANRRMLVTHADGRQSVEVIHNDLGLKSTDKVRMKNELSRQGVKAADVRLYGSNNERRNQEREEAAVRFQAAFRGHKAREHAGRAIHKKNAEELRKAEEEQAHARAQKKAVYRPKLRSAYGF